MKFLFVRVTENRKTGPIPVTYSDSRTCPSACPFKGVACYAEQGPTMMAWNRVDKGKGDSVDWDTFLKHIKGMYRHQIWRHNVAGDLVGLHNVIDTQKLEELVRANHGKNGFGYTHYPVNTTNYLGNLEALRNANNNGLTLNLSADSLKEADEVYGLGVPVVCVVDTKAPDHLKTPEGRHVIVCPAERGVIDCARCGLCQKKDRKAIVAFRAHGVKKNTVNRMLTVLNS